MNPYYEGKNTMMTLYNFDDSFDDFLMTLLLPGKAQDTFSVNS